MKKIFAILTFSILVMLSSHVYSIADDNDKNPTVHEILNKTAKPEFFINNNLPAIKYVSDTSLQGNATSKNTDSGDFHGDVTSKANNSGDSQEVDFRSYMKNLQRKVKQNWDPPRDNVSKRVVTKFTIAKDGRLMDVDILKSSGDPESDKAAISAVKEAAPFGSLPDSYKEDTIPIEFTFDFNVFGTRKGSP